MRAISGNLWVLICGRFMMPCSSRYRCNRLMFASTLSRSMRMQGVSSSLGDILFYFLLFTFYFLLFTSHFLLLTQTRTTDYHSPTTSLPSQINNFPLHQSMSLSYFFGKAVDEVVGNGNKSRGRNSRGIVVTVTADVITLAV